MAGSVESSLKELIAQASSPDPAQVCALWSFSDLLPQYKAILGEADGATQVTSLLRNQGSFQDYEKSTGAPGIWSALTFVYIKQQRWHDALTVAFGLYRSMLEVQEREGRRLVKGAPLVWIADAYGGLGYVAHEERYLMLTLVEDAIRDQGAAAPNASGSYYRVFSRLGFSHQRVSDYARQIFKAYQEDPERGFFPESVLQDIDPQRGWQLRPPALAEMPLYEVNQKYVKYLFDRLGDRTGKVLERLAEYLLSCMAGCRARTRETSNVTDYDVVCSMNGNFFDFRSEFGRYFVCECKDWREKVGIPVIAKFCRILDSTKARFGILFASEGLAGLKDSKYAAREQQKIFQDRGLIIVVIERRDLEAVVSGENFINILRERYETVRLDLGPKEDTSGKKAKRRSSKQLT
jgi:hypothetical protein